MSYILEGLKKLEQKRKQEEKSPNLLTFQGDSTEKPARSPMWPYALVAVLLLNAGVIIWWIAPWRSTERKTPVPQSAVRKSVSTVAETVPIEQKRESKPVSAKESQQSRAISGSPTAIERKETSETPLPVTKETPAPRPSVSTPAPAAKSKPATDGRIVKLNELPSEIKNSLPDLKMSAHFYSPDQQSRFARVNDKILHEGETLSEDLKVEEINPGGTVFRFKGYRFQININENR
jgi:general secretion pathway protein B